MKPLFTIAILLLSALSVKAQSIEQFVLRQIETFPASRLIDIYKSCFQDYMGPEHLVSDRERVAAYLKKELDEADADKWMPAYYEPCGLDSAYYRIGIRTVKDGLLSEETLLDAFVRSANSGKRPTQASWKARWQMIVDAIDNMNLSLFHYEEDRLFIDSILSIGKYAISHLPEYRAAYHPHYRIIERSIFEREIKPLIEKQ